MRPVSRRESDAILGAMRQVALAGGHAISHADTASILAAGRYLLRRHDLEDISTLPAVEPADLVATLKDRELAAEATKYLAIMVMVDGVLDTGKLARVLAYARALGCNYVRFDAEGPEYPALPTFDHQPGMERNPPEP